MCGIVGYIGPEEGREILMKGLARLEYRGYDSAGIAMLGASGRLQIVRCEGKLSGLASKLVDNPVNGTVGVAHTRWATHGRPSEENAHPHCCGPFALVHNGIIENYASLKDELEKAGHHFESQTDTEVIVRLLDSERRKTSGYKQAVRNTLKKLKGSYALVIVNEEEPDMLVAARKESPLIMGISDSAFFLASDVPAILPYTRQVVYLNDEELVFLSRKGYSIEFLLDGEERHPVVQQVNWNPIMAEKAGYKHFMLKEIYEQPRAIIDTFRSVVDLDRKEVHFPELSLDKSVLESIERVLLVACGTSYHAALVAKYMLEGLCRVPVEVDLASEFRSRDPILDDKVLLLVISQSGETADTRAALKEGLDKGAHCLAIVNVVGSSIARMARGVIYTHAGPEIGVASTKAFTTQLVALYLFALHWAAETGKASRETIEQCIQELIELPGKVEKILSDSDKIGQWARKFKDFKDFLYLARGPLYPIALEGALKLKEISYIHAEGYAAGEMKHGPIALIDAEMPVMVLLKEGPLFEKMISNIQEVKARDGIVLALIEGKPSQIVGTDDNQFVIAPSSQWLSPVLFSVPLQLLAYHVAVLRGTDVDQPRNLAKSVTV
ncbi:MAG: glutamine--fructose-6-phosphate transaminase (isomerizing), partial [Syntrophobacteraceae bacterium]|nr:glutamine--fructose-6-phosphate transaminase (isomerizing) [Syntrophobacteraceae bacterium]